MQHIGYYEAVLQLRGCPETLKLQLKKAIERDPTIAIALVKKIPSGEDWYVTNQKSARRIGSWLQQEFGGQLVTSRKLHTTKRQTGKKVYRVTVLFRYISLKRGSLFIYRGDSYKVLRFGSKLEVKQQGTSRKRLLAYADLPKELWRSN